MPDRKAALEQYRARSIIYDLELALLEPVRRRAVNRLHLKDGETVLDVGCGTGLSLSLLRERIGPRGQIVAIEQSPEMLSWARKRVEQNSWENVGLLCAPVENAIIAVQADAAIFHFTHDILRTPKALANVFRHLRAGARVVAAGLKWSASWAVPINLFVWRAAARSVTSFDGLDAPWSLLSGFVSELSVESLLGGAVYIASATVEAQRNAGAYDRR